MRRSAFSQTGCHTLMDISGKAVLTLLKRIEESNGQNEIRQLSDQLERVILHKQYADA